MKISIDDNIYHALVAKAAEKTIQDEAGDDYCGIIDYCGGNYDDAYDLGIRDGKIIYASKLLKHMEILPDVL